MEEPQGASRRPLVPVASGPRSLLASVAGDAHQVSPPSSIEGHCSTNLGKEPSGTLKCLAQPRSFVPRSGCAKAFGSAVELEVANIGSMRKRMVMHAASMHGSASLPKRRRQLFQPDSSTTASQGKQNAARVCDEDLPGPSGKPLRPLAGVSDVPLNVCLDPGPLGAETMRAPLTREGREGVEAARSKDHVAISPSGATRQPCVGSSGSHRSVLDDSKWPGLKQALAESRATCSDEDNSVEVLVGVGHEVGSRCDAALVETLCASNERGADSCLEELQGMARKKHVESQEGSCGGAGAEHRGALQAGSCVGVTKREGTVAGVIVEHGTVASQAGNCATSRERMSVASASQADCNGRIRSPENSRKRECDAGTHAGLSEHAQELNEDGDSDGWAELVGICAKRRLRRGTADTMNSFLRVLETRRAGAQGRDVHDTASDPERARICSSSNVEADVMVAKARGESVIPKETRGGAFVPSHPSPGRNDVFVLSQSAPSTASTRARRTKAGRLEAAKASKAEPVIILDDSDDEGERSLSRHQVLCGRASHAAECLGIPEAPNSVSPVSVQHSQCPPLNSTAVLHNVETNSTSPDLALHVPAATSPAVPTGSVSWTPHAPPPPYARVDAPLGTAISMHASSCVDRNATSNMGGHQKKASSVPSNANSSTSPVVEVGLTAASHSSAAPAVCEVSPSLRPQASPGAHNRAHATTKLQTPDSAGNGKSSGSTPHVRASFKSSSDASPAATVHLPKLPTAPKPTSDSASCKASLSAGYAQQLVAELRAGVQCKLASAAHAANKTEHSPQHQPIPRSAKKGPVSVGSLFPQPTVNAILPSTQPCKPAASAPAPPSIVQKSRHLANAATYMPLPPHTVSGGKHAPAAPGMTLLGKRPAIHTRGRVASTSDMQSTRAGQRPWGLSTEQRSASAPAGAAFELLLLTN
jgi:hypothetical protein